MYQLIVCDYDGTLVANTEVLSSQFYTKLHNLSSRGTVFCVASGRPYTCLKKLFTPVKQEIAFIASDGAQIMFKNCLLGKFNMKLSSVKTLAAAALDLGYTPIACMREENHRITRDILENPFLFSSDIFKLIIAKNGNCQRLKQLATELPVRVCYEDNNYLEFCLKNADKGAAVELLMKKFNVTPEKLCVIGDGKNDVSMLALTQNCFRPNSACPEVVDIANPIDVKKFILEQ